MTLSLIRKAIRIFALATLIAPTVSGQVSETELIGTWKPTKLLFDPADVPGDASQKIKIFENALLQSTFTFEANHKARILIDLEGLGVEKGYWRYDSATANLEIMDWKERNDAKPGLLMGFLVTRKDGSLLFSIQESPFTVLVEKKNNPSSPLPASQRKADSSKP